MLYRVISLGLPTPVGSDFFPKIAECFMVLGTQQVKGQFTAIIALNAILKMSLFVFTALVSQNNADLLKICNGPATASSPGPYIARDCM